MPARRTLAALAIASLAVGCANAASPGAGGSSGVIAYPTQPDALVLRIDTSGGFVAPSATQGQIPVLSLFGDGRVITMGAQTEIYPQPALPPVLVQTVDPAGIQMLLRAALDAGLDRTASYTDLGSVGIADAPTTTFTLAADGAVHTVVVYALGMTGHGPGSMPPSEARARAALQAFAGEVGNLQGFLPSGSLSPSRPFRPAAMRVFVTHYHADEGLKEPSLAWPGTAGLATFGDRGQLAGERCGVVAGNDLALLMPLAMRANQLTPWTSEDARWALVLRPLLPDESGC